MRSANWQAAAKVFEHINWLNPQDVQAKYNLGICNFHLKKYAEAIKCFQEVSASRKKVEPQLQYYLAASLHGNHQFDLALKAYKEFLRFEKSEATLRNSAKEAIKNCAFAIAHEHQKTNIVVENAGPFINSPGDEFAPIPSPNDENRLYFSAIRDDNIGGRRDHFGLVDTKSGTYKADMFACQYISEQWHSTKPVNTLLNSAAHDVILDFSADGSEMYFFKGHTLWFGEILIDTFDHTSLATSKNPARFAQSPLRPELGDQSLFFLNDTVLFFSSSRPGGFGGFDIYLSVKNKNNWLAPINLGPKINSAYDETAPCLTADGKTLYFSSNRSDRSYGGFDLFKSNFDEAQKNWSDSKNMGLPINSADDDNYLRIDYEGTKAFFSSNRKDGYGKNDIYIARLPNATLPNTTTISQVPIPKTGAPTQTDLATAPEKASSTTPSATTEVPTPINLPVVQFTIIEDINQPNNTLILESIAKTLNTNPKLNLLISSHIHPTEDPTTDWNTALQYTDAVLKKLKTLGVAESTIQLNIVGGQYPTAKSPDPNATPFAVIRHNNRFEFAINSRQTPTNCVWSAIPQVPDQYATPEGNRYHHITRGLYYKIHLATTPQPEHKLPRLSEYQNVSIEKIANQTTTTFTTGLYKTWFSAHQMQKEMLRNGIAEPYVIAYFNGFILNPEQIRQIADTHPDLQNLISE